MREIVRRSDKLMRKIDWDLATNKYEEAFAKIDFGVGNQTSANGGFAGMLRDAWREVGLSRNLSVRTDNGNWESIPTSCMEIEFVTDSPGQEIFDIREIPRGLRPDIVIFDDPDLNIAGQLEF